MRKPRMKQPRSRVIHVTVPARVYTRLEAMAVALERELTGVHVTVAGVTRRILYQHSALRTLGHRHQPDPPQELEL